MTVDKLVSTLSEMYVKIINNKLPLKTVPSVMLWSSPGIGKSQAVREVASEIEAKTGKKTVVTDVRLMLFNPVDLRGIPTANEEKTLAVWLKPKIFDMDASDNVVNVLFLDEISAAPQSVQAAAYQITLDRLIGEHKLPENCIVIAAGNRITDKSVAYKMPKALANRLLHIEVESDFDSWKNWAINKGINPKILGFLSFRRDILNTFEESGEELAFATPRTWEMASNILNYVNDDIKEAYPLLSGILGSGVAIEFRTWDSINKDLPKIEDIFDGKNPKLPGEPATLYALVASMISYAKDHKDDIEKIENSILYGLKMPPDFSVILLKSYFAISDEMKNKLIKMPCLKKWMDTKGKLLNAID